MQDSTTNQGVGQGNLIERLWWKQFGKEMLSFDIVFDALLLRQKPDGSFRLRVPLVARVDYKGFRAICIAFIQISQSLNPDLGFYGGVYNWNDDQLKQELSFVGDCLNLKDNRTKKKGSYTFESVPVSNFIRVYSYQSQEGDNKRGIDSPTTKKWFDHHFGELEYNDVPKYILKTAEIFPYDADQQDLLPHPDRVLRPELVCSYERPLKSDARKMLPLNALTPHERSTGPDGVNRLKESLKGEDDEEQINVNELNEASRFLKRTMIP